MSTAKQRIISILVLACLLLAAHPQVLRAGEPSQDNSLLSLKNQLGKNRDIGLVVWGNPKDLLKHRRFFKRAVEAGITVVWISSGQFVRLSMRHQQALLRQADKAGLKTLGFIQGEPGWDTSPWKANRHMDQLLEALLPLKIGRHLKLGFALDVEPHTLKSWSGNLAPYIELIRKVAIPKVRRFEETIQKQHDRRIVSKRLWLTRFEPFWWEEGHITSKGKQIRGIQEIPFTVVAAMTYRNSAEELLQVAQPVLSRSRANRNEKILLGVETKPPSPGIPAHITMYGRENEIPKLLKTVWKNLSKEDQDQTIGFFIHIGKSGKLEAPRRADQILRGWLSLS